MRWSIIRLIWLRELRDQLRDRRTLFMIVGLPILLYPIAGFGMMQLAMVFGAKPSAVGVMGAEHLPPVSINSPTISPVPPVAWWTVLPAAPGVPLGGVASAAGARALALARHFDPHQDYPPLLLPQDGGARLPPLYLEAGPEHPADQAERIVLRLFAGGDRLPPAPVDPDSPATAAYLDRIDREPLDTKQVDLLLVVPPGFLQRLDQGGRPPLFLLTRDNDERSRLVNARFGGILARWKKHLKGVRLLRQGLPPDFDEPFELIDRDRAKPGSKRAAEELFDLLVRIFPFVLVMWSLTGALYPAVDLCAGEKERGTMETLLISPASREEIVWGKFLTIWFFSAATALLNLLSMGLTTWKFSGLLSSDTFRPSVLFWGVLLLLPLSAFFSALCLAVGAYARSSKEGQYYLMPLFLLTMPLIFLTLAPGVELNPFYSMVPVTGVALLLQKLMAAGSPAWEHGLYVGPVLAPMIIYSWMALRWAIQQFQREEVLFREAERIDVRLWIQRLLREKELLPTTGEALCCFAVILGLRWLVLGVGGPIPLVPQVLTTQLAFVAAPPLFMTLMLTSWPRQGIGLRLPPWWAWPLAALLGLALAPLVAGLTFAVLDQFPTIKALLAEHQPLGGQLLGLGAAEPLKRRLWFFLVLAVLPAFCEELAFRGYILTGLARRFKPTAVVFLSGFLFAIYQMNVFQFLPHFVFGSVLAFVVLRTNSVLPAVLIHLVFNTLTYGPLLLPALDEVLPTAMTHAAAAGLADTPLFSGVMLAFAAGGALMTAVLLFLIGFISGQGPGSGEFPTIHGASVNGAAKRAATPAPAGDGAGDPARFDQ
jgi:sodium transport system permease protein